MKRCRRLRDERGETLIEILVAIAIRGIGAVAILAGLQVSIRVSDIHRKEATGGAYVRSAAEAVSTYVGAAVTNYKACAGANYYSAQPSLALTLPPGYVLTQAAAEKWSGTAWISPCSSDNGVQRVKLTVTSPSTSGGTAAETLYLVLRQPCNGTSATPCTS
jgi:prepilin-type N-terminal cleavage/methylation domain-containing protein